MILGIAIGVIIAGLILWYLPWVAYAIAMLASLKFMPAGPIVVTVLFGLFGLIRWPYTAHGACKGTGKNTGSTRLQWGHCGGCQGGEVPALGARTVRRAIGRPL